MRKFVCGVCGYEYKEDEEGRVFEELIEDWKCPMCQAEKGQFVERREEDTSVVKEEAKDPEEDSEGGEE